jgi:hypothetical protein
LSCHVLLNQWNRTVVGWGPWLNVAFLYQILNMEFDFLVLQKRAFVYKAIGKRVSQCQINCILNSTGQRYSCRWGEDVSVFFH